MRKLTDHIANPVNDRIEITVMDDPGAGGAHHHYLVVVPNGHELDVHFQNGPIAEKGVNGVTQEVLLAIVIDRLRCFQNGAFACDENALARQFCEDALAALKLRTLSRVARGVEGKSVV